MTRRKRVGYVLKQYPRLSETFVLNEIIGVESKGVDTAIYSLRPADEGRFHPDLAKVAGPVSYLNTSIDRNGFVDAMRWMPNALDGGVDAAVGFVDRLPAERRARLLAQGIELARRATEAGLDHLHAHFLTVASHTVHVAHLLTGISYSVTAHAKDIYRRGIDWGVAAAVADRARVIVTVCEANKAHLDERLPDANVVRIYNGLGPQPPAVGWAEREPNLLLGVGRLVPKKGFDVFIDAVAQMAAAGHEVSAVIVGDGELRSELEAHAATVGVADRIDFVGALTQDQVQRCMRTAALLVAPCVVGPDGNQDALPTVLVESLGAGLPAVTTDVAGIAEIIGDGEQGRIVEPRPDAVAAACVDLLGDPEAWAKMAASGPAKLAARFDRSETVNQLVDLFVSPNSVDRLPPVAAATG